MKKRISSYPKNLVQTKLMRRTFATFMGCIQIVVSIMLVTIRSDSERLPPVLAGGVRGLTYDEQNRGKFQNIARAKQLISFEGLRRGKITGTDWDYVIEYHNLAWLLAEVKHRGNSLDRGQWLSYKIAIDDYTRAGKEAVFFRCEHSVDNCQDIVMLKDVMVIEVYYKGTKKEIKPITLYEAQNRFFDMVDRKYGRENTTEV